MDKPFTPISASTVNIAATATSARIQLTEAQSDQVEITNDGPDMVFCELGTSSVTASAATGYPVAPGQSKVVNRAGTQLYGAAITASGKTATVYFTCGNGT